MNYIPLTQEDIDNLKKLPQKLNLPQISHKQTEKIYRNNLKKKYSKNLLD